MRVGYHTFLFPFPPLVAAVETAVDQRVFEEAIHVKVCWQLCAMGKPTHLDRIHHFGQVRSDKASCIELSDVYQGAPCLRQPVWCCIFRRFESRDRLDLVCSTIGVFGGCSRSVWSHPVSLTIVGGTTEDWPPGGFATGITEISKSAMMTSKSHINFIQDVRVNSSLTNVPFWLNITLLTKIQTSQ